MADAWSLLLILAAVYLFECFLWLRRGGVAITSWLGKRSHLRFPGLFLSNWKGGLILSPPVPPLGQVFVSEQPLFSVNQLGVYSYSAASIERDWRPVQPARFFLLDAIREVDARQKKVYIDGQPFLSATSEVHATQIAAFLGRLKSLPGEKRAKAIARVLSESTNSELIAERIESFHKQSRTIHLLANFLFVYLFGLVPAVFWLFGLRQSWLPLLALLLVQTTTIALLFRRAHKRLFTEPNDDWFTPFFTMLLAPSAAIRARDALSRNLLLGFHPVAVAAQLCSREDFEKLARHTMRDLQFPRLPITPNNDPNAIEVERSFRMAILETLHDVLRRQKVDAKSLCAKPLPTEEVHRAYCPRCETQYVSNARACNECGGIQLQPL